MATKVLLITDDAACAKRLNKALAGSGIDSTRCATVREAFSIIAAGSVDLVFCQERLSDGTFREVLDFAALRHPIPLVVCSNFYNSKTYIDAMSLGAFDYVAFPFPSQDLEWIVGNALRNASPHAAMHRQTDAA